MAHVPAEVSQAALALLAALASWLMLTATAWLRAHQAQGVAGLVLGRLEALVEDVVHEVAQTLVDALKAGAADGDLTAAEAKDALDAALVKLKSYLGPAGLAELEKVLGFGGSQLDAFLTGKIEAEVHRQKAPALIESAVGIAPAEPAK